MHAACPVARTGPGRGLGLRNRMTTCRAARRVRIGSPQSDVRYRQFSGVSPHAWGCQRCPPRPQRSATANRMALSAGGAALPLKRTGHSGNTVGVVLVESGTLFEPPAATVRSSADAVVIYRLAPCRVRTWGVSSLSLHAHPPRSPRHTAPSLSAIIPVRPSDGGHVADARRLSTAERQP